MVAALVGGGVARARDRNRPWYSPPLLVLPDISFMCSFYETIETGEERAIAIAIARAMPQYCLGCSQCIIYAPW